MTKKIITSYTLFLLMALAIGMGTSVDASEVTGNLSSDSSSNVPVSGNISGTVSSFSGGGSSSSGGGSSSNAPSGSVLGASIDNTIQSPGFPNAGFAPNKADAAPTYWSVIVAFFKGMLSF